MNSTKESLPFGWTLRYVLCNYSKRPNCWYLLVPERALACVAWHQSASKDLGINLGFLSIVGLLPFRWAKACVLLLALKKRHTWLEFGAWIFCQSWVHTLSDEAKEAQMVSRGMSVVLGAAIAAVCWLVGRYIAGLGVLKSLF